MQGNSAFMYGLQFLAAYLATGIAVKAVQEAAPLNMDYKYVW